MLSHKKVYAFLKRRPRLVFSIFGSALLIILLASSLHSVAIPQGITLQKHAMPSTSPKNDVLARWSDPHTWGGSLPTAQAAVTIPAGKQILLDVSPPSLKSLSIEGSLICDTKDLTLSADWIMVHRGGTFACGSQQEPFHNHLVITLTGNNVNENIMDMGTKVLGIMGGTLELHGENQTAWTHLALNAQRGSTQVTLDQPVNWYVGDRIVITSTDYDAAQAEEITIRAIAGTQITLSMPLKYSHWGTIQSFNGSTIDERAEVGLLSHNIVVQGDSGSAATGFGGQTMITYGSTTHIEGVEFFHMGQKHLKARYPVHWHLAGDAPGSYIKDSTIDHSFNRCLTIHGTNQVEVNSVVAFDTIGHCFFLEDGVETGNVLEHNLGILTRIPAKGEAILSSDNTPATYWITNPNNIFRGNVAAGSQFFGFWFALPEHPTGLSKNANNDRLVWPRHTPLGEFSDNVAHSTSDNGIHIDDGANPDGTTTGYAYEPRQNPAAPSPSVTATFKNFTAYKTRNLGGWLRGSNLLLIGAKVADTVTSFIFAQGQIILQDSLVVGETANKGNPASDEATGLDGRSLPQPWDAHTPITGFDFYDGPNGVQNVTFINFRSNSQRQAGALSYNPENNSPIDVRNFSIGVHLLNANAVYLLSPDQGRDGGKQAMIYDTDGSLSGKSGQYITANSSILATSTCSFRQEWNAYICPNRYGNFSFEADSGETMTPLTVKRNDSAAITLAGEDATYAETAAIPSQSYAVQFGKNAPHRLQIDLQHLRAGDSIQMQLAYPSGLNLTLYRDAEQNQLIIPAKDLAEFQASHGTKYYYDKTTGTLYLLAVVRGGNDWARINVEIH